VPVLINIYQNPKKTPTVSLVSERFFPPLFPQLSRFSSAVELF
jgi:hypothetical protein